MAPISFSIVIPLYNKASTISRTIQSILRQDYAYFELIIVDDESQDDSVNVVRSFDDNRIRLFRKKNGGPSSARNYGTIQANNDWVFFIDADDTLLEGSLTAFSQIIQKYSGRDIYVGNYYLEKSNQTSLYCDNMKEGPVNNPYKELFFHRLLLCAGTTVYKREIVLQNMFMESLRRYEDAELMLRLFKVSTIVVFNRPIMCYHRDDSMASKPRNLIDEDYLGHLSFDNTGFWSKMVMYDYFVEALNTYPNDAYLLYGKPSLYMRVAHRVVCEWRLLLNGR